MIVFDLLCTEGHRFEGWFGSGLEFASQRKRGLLSCPKCGSANVERVPSATRINTGAVPTKAPAPQSPRQEPALAGRDPFALAQILYSRLLDEILTKTEDVGADFSVEARRIHYDQAPVRPIRGEATEEEHDALLDEGIPVARVLIPPTHRLN
ncbi:MAG: DUF1178 family protein [Burkholderiales bacterium]